MARNEFIKVSRRQAFRVLELYTIYGYTQQEIGEMVFSKGMERKIDRGVLARRVLHQFGLNMHSRQNFSDVTFTPKSIRAIMDNPFIIYPLLIPMSGDPIPYISFENELVQQLNGTGRYSKARGWFLNALAVAAILGLQYAADSLSHNAFVMGLPLLGAFAVSILLSLFDEDRQEKSRGKTVIGLGVSFLICYIIYKIAT